MSILNYFSKIEPQLTETKKKTFGVSEDVEELEPRIAQTWRVFTDGSCLDNGTRKAVGGIGVFFADDSPDNMSLPWKVSQGSVTNNICELEAVKHALHIIIQKDDFEIDDYIRVYTDSRYLIDCITKWAGQWARNGWMRKGPGGKKSKVKNVELIKEIRSLYLKYSVEFIHCKAHTTFQGDSDSKAYQIWYGNKRADELAVLGSQQN